MSKAEVTIRHAEPEDYAGIHRIYAGPQVVWGTLQLPYPTLERWRKRLAEPGEGVISLVASVEGDMVGHLHLHTYGRAPRRRHVGQVGMAVRDDWQGRGVGSALMEAAVTLADKWLNLERLELEVYTDNPAAVHLYEKFGFLIEGTLRRYAFRDGQYVDAYAMGRLRE